jgi:hypothetical protein
MSPHRSTAGQNVDGYQGTYAAHAWTLRVDVGRSWP